jgi:flavorubredoxin
MSSLKILPDIYSVGVVDWNKRFFHGHTYTTKRGTSYNSYLVVDEKIALIDTVMANFSDELIENISEILPVEKIDYIVALHVELDHSGTMAKILKLAPKAKVFATSKCKEGLYRHFYRDWDFQIIKTGDKLKLGKRTLTFIEAPMIHWPDSCFAYCPEEELLFPNDAFGQHYATSERFDDETDECALMDEAAKYYANILWPFSSIILKKLEEIQNMGIPIKIIAPAHGVIWRKGPSKIINSYFSWAKNETLNKIVVIYETMYGATEKMARKIVEAITDSGVLVKLYDVAISDRAEIIKDMLDAKGFIIGSSCHDNDMLPNMAGFLEFLKGLKPKKRMAAVFGSYGWTPKGATEEIEDVLKEAGIEIAQESLPIKYIPDESEINRCYEFGQEFAKKVKVLSQDE